MTREPMTQTPLHSSYDVIIIGGAIMGSATAWFLSDLDDFDGSVLVVERDPTYEFAATSHTTSCIRQQFSTALNVRISQYAADFINNFRDRLGADPRVPHLPIQSYGYMYLANTDDGAAILRKNQQVQRAAGAQTQLMSAQEISDAYPFYSVDDIVLGSINLVDEGYWDAGAMFTWWKRQARERGVEFITNTAVGVTTNAANTRVESVSLASGEAISCGHLVNAAGPRAAEVAKMAGITLPVEPRKRYSWIFRAETPLDRDLPLTIDPSGVHVRENGGGTYQAGGHAAIDPAVAYDDFTMDHALWQDHIWPALATRIPQFEAIKVISGWAGHYAMNTFDHNAVVGPHDRIGNFVFLNGFSGHGLQQAPALGRGVAEYVTYGGYRSMDLSPFNYDRIPRGIPFTESAII